MQAKEKSNAVPSVVVKKIIHADRDRVFDAWTKPELMKHWFVGGKGTAKAAVDLRVGGKYTNEMLIEGSAACSGDGVGETGIKSYFHHGEYLEIVRPERIVFTWNSPSVQNTIVTVELRAQGSATEVTITHELPTLADCKGHQEGWTYALSGLGAFLG